MSDLWDFFRGIPVITRYWFGASLIVPLLGRFGLISARFCYLSFELVLYKLQLWRPFTALFFYPVSPQTGLNWLMMLYLMYNYSKNLESGLFDGRPADFLFMLMLNWANATLLCMALEVPFLMEVMVLSVLYVWCQTNRDAIVTFWFGMQFKAMHLPWVLAGFNAILRGGGLSELIGIVVGHIYFFLAFSYPRDHGGSDLIRTPQFLYKYFPNDEARIRSMDGRTERRRTQTQNNTHSWGQGQALGSY